MDEYELKILEVDEQKMIEKIKQIGGKLFFAGDIQSLYYDLPDKSLRNSSRMLRLRQKGNSSILTLKIKKEDDQAKLNDEREVFVGDFERTRQILLGLGYVEFAQDKRRRKSFKIGDAVVEINIYPDIPPFIEIETQSKQRLKEIVELLGYSLKDTKIWSGKEVLKHYGKPTAE